MTLKSEIKMLANMMVTGKTKKLKRIAHSLENRREVEGFSQLSKAIQRISESLAKDGLFPLRLKATFWSQNQNRQPDNCSVGFFWSRNDLVVSRGYSSSKVKVSAAPSFSMSIYGDEFVCAGFRSNFHTDARNHMIRNVLADKGFLKDSINNLRGFTNWASWSDETVDFSTFNELQQIALAAQKGDVPGRHSTFGASAVVSDNALSSVPRFVSRCLAIMGKVRPIFFAHHFPLQPKGAGKAILFKMEMSRERLRKEMANLEEHGQRIDCPTCRKDDINHVVSHLVRGIHLPSNAILLCPNCANLQRPSTSDILLLRKKDILPNGSEIRYVKIHTKAGWQEWAVRCSPGHKLLRHKKAS